MKFLLLLLTVASLIACGKKKATPPTITPPETSGSQDLIFESNFENQNSTTLIDESTNEATPPYPTDSTDTYIISDTTSFLNKILSFEKNRASLKNFLFDQILDINLDISKKVPELIIKMHPNNEILNFQNVQSLNGVYDYVLGRKATAEKDKLIVNFTAKVTFYTTNRSIALIQIMDTLNQNNISFLRVEKKGYVYTEHHWYEWYPTNYSIINKVNQNFFGTVVINNELQKRMNKAFINLLKDITYNPSATYIHYHAIKHNSDTSKDLSHAEKIEIDIADSFKFTSVDLRVDEQRLVNKIRISPTPLHWSIGFSKEKTSEDNQGFWSNLNIANYYFKQPNLATQAFAKDPSKKDYLTWINLKNQDIETILQSTNIQLNLRVKPSVGKNKEPIPFTLNIGFPNEVHP